MSDTAVCASHGFHRLTTRHRAVDCGFPTVAGRSIRDDLRGQAARTSHALRMAAGTLDVACIAGKTPNPDRVLERVESLRAQLDRLEAAALAVRAARPAARPATGVQS